MTKPEAAEHLRKLGYTTQAVDGLVQIYVMEPMPKKERDTLEKTLQDIGYNSSWGWKRVKEEEMPKI